MHKHKIKDKIIRVCKRYSRSNINTISNLSLYITRVLYLAHFGERKAEKVYNKGFELMDVKYRNKLAFILGEFNEELLEKKLDYSISYFIPYMINTNSRSTDDWTQRNNDNNEIRLFAGTTNFTTIFKRVLMYRALQRLMVTHNDDLLRFFLQTI